MGVLHSTPSRLVDDLARLNGTLVTSTAEDALDQDKGGGYDYVIVGGGTAGCVLASRISEDPGVSVLLVEAGARQNILSNMPMGATMLWHTEADWDFHTTPQPQLDDRSIHWPRGKILGGSGSINYMVFHHCDPADFDAWERLGAKGWGYESLEKYFIKSERHIPRRPGSTAKRGQDGPIVCRTPLYPPIQDVIVNAGANMGISPNQCFNTSEGTSGAGNFEGCVDERGVRHSTAAAYLTPEVMQRPNLTVAIQAMTEKILFAATADELPTAVGVLLCKDANGPRYMVRARKEVIITSGAIGTPHLLLLSGVGPRSQLSQFGIPLVCDLPQVGEHLLDHFLPGSMNFRMKPGHSWDPHYYESLPSLLALIRYQMFGTGPLAGLPVPTAIFVRSGDPKLSSLFGTPLPVADMASGPRAPDMELGNGSACATENGTKPPYGARGIATGCVVLKPQSKGTVKLRSGRIFDHPEINPNYLSTESDWNMAIMMNKLLLRLFRTSPLSELADLRNSEESVDDFFWPGDANPDKFSDDDMRDFIRKHGRTAWHPTSTARIGTTADNSVVDSNLRVHGVRNLRVCDASVFPDQVSGHPFAVIVAMAERAADLIKGMS
ncbi:GMC oxidoreductase [Epithele typhae]|uniref:GMC oxidoreductase n=1 Tax=Epithele typhae TaxID=378194 RepID=UPI002008E76D|nr:GMC oxidoreductase [Epithele typhae]KAH9929526.1 GMC oxidoreductase [Epithele typhae]